MEILTPGGPRAMDQMKNIPRSDQMKIFSSALKVSSFSVVEVGPYLPGLC